MVTKGLVRMRPTGTSDTCAARAALVVGRVRRLWGSYQAAGA
ncbi:hypothetical protein C8D87_104753 [Lentzea atacamensis]|uniref:Uncharacterized protein n=1 Tax=Lentzea atacamensis TaxID=531938 RepID=A0ABX9ECI7_9PSEU|nr:hypothetical protein C8D87_104753 [Lentzea atacamensis]